MIKRPKIAKEFYNNNRKDLYSIFFCDRHCSKPLTNIELILITVKKSYKVIALKIIFVTSLDTLYHITESRFIKKKKKKRHHIWKLEVYELSLPTSAKMLNYLLYGTRVIVIYTQNSTTSN